METTNKKAVNKAARLVWLLLYRLSGGDMSTYAYAKKFGIHQSNAGVDEEDLSELTALVDETLPNLKEIVGLILSPDDLQALPILPTPLGDHSEVSVNFRVNHKTGEIKWDPFIQKVYSGENKLAEVKIKRGGAKLKKQDNQRIW